MPLKKFRFIRKVTIPVALAVSLHVAVIAGVLYMTVGESIKLPTQEQKVMSVTMVNPADFAPPPPPPQAEPTPPEPEPEPEVVPEPPPPPEAVVIPEPPKPKPKPVKKPVVKPKVKPVERPVEKPTQTVQTAPVNSNQPVNKPFSQPPASTNAKSDSGPRPLQRGQPGYPARALALRIEGRVRVQFDVDSDGRVQNIRVLSAEPRNMFEREVKQAMNKWRYEPKAASNLIVNLVFKIKGGSSVE